MCQEKEDWGRRSDCSLGNGCKNEGEATISGPTSELVIKQGNWNWRKEGHVKICSEPTCFPDQIGLQTPRECLLDLGA